MDEEAILESHPELNYVKRWTDAIDKRRYEEAVAILDEGLRYAEGKNNSSSIEHFQELKKITYAWLTQSRSKQERKKVDLCKRQEVRLCCSFCGKKRSAVSTLIAGPRVYICDRCIEICSQIIEGYSFKELDCLEQWGEAISQNEYEKALSISRNGIKLAKELASQRRSALFIKLFQHLGQISKKHLVNGTELTVRKEVECSFCGKTNSETTEMVIGAAVSICNECIKLCSQILFEIHVPTPS